MRFKQSNGLSTGYFTRGSGDVIAFLHPVGTDKAFWEPIVRLLEDRFRLVAIDLRGHGDSDVPREGFSLGDLAADVAELLAVLAGGERVVLVGCSMGGMVAQEVALSYPDRVRALVLTNTAHTLPEQGREMMRLRAQDARSNMPRLVATTLDRWFSPAFWKGDPGVVAAIRQRLLDNDPIVHSWSWEAISSLETASRLGALDLPVLVTTGEEDVSTPPAFAQAIAASIKGADCRIVPGTGHMLPLEKPDLLARWIGELATAAGTPPVPR